jgi:hypothetical protein
VSNQRRITEPSALREGKIHNCVGIRHKEAPLFVLNFKRHKLHKSTAQSSSREGNVQLVLTFM